jgi:competence protein ComEA
VKHGLAGTTRTPLMRIMLLAFSLCLANGCVTRERNQPTIAQASETTGTESTNAARININTASADELEKLPGIGKALAGRIIEHREKFGPFRRPAHLIIVRGISDKRFRALQDLITVQ